MFARFIFFLFFDGTLSVDVQITMMKQPDKLAEVFMTMSLRTVTFDENLILFLQGCFSSPTAPASLPPVPQRASTAQ